MRLEDFVKDLSINLNQNNWQAYKIQAASMLMDFDALSGEELAEIINTGLSYNDVLTKIFDNNIVALNKAVKKIMTETTYILHFVKDMYLNDKSSYAMLNDTSKNFLARPSMIHVADMSDELFDDWIGNPSSDLYTQYNTHNRLFEIINTFDKNLITKVVNHKNFKNLASHYPLIKLLSLNELLTKSTFDKVLVRTMQIIKSGNNWNTDFSKELSILGKSPFLEIKHFDLVSDVQASAIIETMKANNTVISPDLMEYLYQRTGDELFLPQTAKDVFLF